MGRIPEAIFFYERACESDDDKITSSTNYELAVILENAHRYREAEDRYKRALELGNHWAGAALGSLLISLRRYDEAEEVLRVAIDSPNDDAAATAMFCLASICLWNDNDDEGEDLLWKSLARSAYADPSASKLLAEHLHRHDRLDEAEAMYRRAIEAGEGSMCRVDLARLYERQGRPADAEREYQEVLSSSEENAVVEASISLAGLLVNQEGDLDGAREHLQRAIDLGNDGQLAKASGLLGAIQIAQGEPEDAMSSFRRIFDLAQGQPELIGAAWLGIGASLGSIEHMDEAKAAFEAAIEEGSAEAATAAFSALAELDENSTGDPDNP